MSDPTNEPTAADARLKAALDIFVEVCDLPTSRREKALEERCGSDALLRNRVEALLKREAARDAEFAGEPADPGAEIRTGGGARIAMDLTERSERMSLPLLQGRYRILGILGQGGMGTVYEAEQSSPRRLVALKALRQAAFGGEQALRRFALEAEVLGRLQHPGIAQVYEAGFGEDGSGGPAWIAMELVRGKPVVEAVAARGLDRVARLEIFLQICDAVTFAHQKGVIHRDLKPGNILLVDDSTTVKVLDFGVARVLTEEGSDAWTDATQLTGPGQLIGTLPYMSPEQVAGDPDAIDVRTDVYALGVILYELLAGRRPFDFGGRAAEEAARIIRDEEPPPPSALQSRSGVSPATALRGDLDAIALMAIAKEPRRRYQSVALLADDVRSHLRGEPVAARAASTWYVVARRARRYRVPITAAALLALATVVFAVRASIDAARSAELAAEANRATAATESARSDLARQLSAARLEQARLLSAAGNLGAALSIIRTESAVRTDTHVRWAMRDLAARHPCITSWAPHSGAIRSIALIPDASLLLTIGDDSRAVVSGFDGSVVQCIDLGSIGISCAYDPAVGRCVVGLFDGGIVAFDPLEPGSMRVLARQGSAVRAVAAFEGSVAGGMADGTVELIDVEGRHQSLPRRPQQVNGIAFADADTIITADQTGEVTRTRIASGAVRVLARHDGAAQSFALDRQRGRVISGASDRFLRISDLNGDRGQLAEVDGGNGTIRSVGVDTATGDIFVSGWWSLDRWDGGLISKRRLASPPDGPITTVFAPEFGLAASAHGDGVVRLWAVEPTNVNGGGAAIDRLRGRTTCAMAPDGTFLACGDSDGTVQVADARSGRVIATMPPHARRVRSLTVDPTGTIVASASDDGVLQLADARTGAPIARMTGVRPQTAGSLAFSPDGRMLAAPFGDSTMRLLATPALTLVRTLSTANHEPLSVAWSPDGQRIATTARELQVRLWSVDGTLLSEVNTAETPWTLAFSPDGATLAVGSWSRVVELLDAKTLAATGRLTGAAGLITQVAWLTSSSTPGEDFGGPELLASSVDGAMRVWDTRDRRVLFEFTPFVGSDVVSCATDAAGHVIAASGASGEAACWDLGRWDNWAKSGVGLR